jgi:hypothetical protein
VKKASLIDGLAFSFLQMDQILISYTCQIENFAKCRTSGLGLGTLALNLGAIKIVAAGFSLRRLKLAATVKTQQRNVGCVLRTI